jgi:hypothetical protein
VSVVTRAPGALETLSVLRRIVRNPMDGWPPEVYTDKLVRSRMLGRTNYFVTDPELVGRVLVDEADKMVKAEPMRRALEPALGQGILTAEGARWRGQRRTDSRSLAEPAVRKHSRCRARNDASDVRNHSRNHAVRLRLRGRAASRA